MTAASEETKMIKKPSIWTALLLALFLAGTVNAQNFPAKPCASSCRFPPAAAPTSFPG
jgi:hypothetical protein